MPATTLVRRECRKCGKTSNMAFSYDACPHCHTPYGRLEFGADRVGQREAEAAEAWAPLEDSCKEPGSRHRFEKDEDGVKRCASCRKRQDQLKGARR